MRPRACSCAMPDRSRCTSGRRGNRRAARHPSQARIVRDARLSVQSACAGRSVGQFVAGQGLFRRGPIANRRPRPGSRAGGPTTTSKSLRSSKRLTPAAAPRSDGQGMPAPYSMVGGRDDGTLAAGGRNPGVEFSWDITCKIGFKELPTPAGLETEE